jgi:hypothetical protein
MPLTNLAVLASLALGAAAERAVDAPVAAVTVYSDRARVTRQGHVDVQGTTQVDLPLLRDNIDPGSIRLEADGAEVTRVDIEPVAPDDFPRDAAKALLAQLDDVDLRIQRVQADEAALAAQLAVLQRLAPTLPSDAAPRPLLKLSSAGWTASLRFIAGATEPLQGRYRDGQAKLAALQKEKDHLSEEARKLGGADRRGGYRVKPTLKGAGRATVRLTYLVGGARWFPTYDLQLEPAAGQVRVQFAGLVSQETGEDWTDAQLTLSTAALTSPSQFPRLRTWAIGQRDRYLPAPVARVTPAPDEPVPQPPAPLQSVGDLEEQLLRSRLASRGVSLPSSTSSQSGYRAAVGGKNTINFEDDVISGDLVRPDAEMRVAESPRPRAPSKMAMDAPAPMPAPPPSVQSAPRGGMARSESKPMEMDREEVDEVTIASAKMDEGRSGRRAESSELGLLPPAGFVFPSYAADLPASLAGGYDLSYGSLRPESVPSGGGARRVALLSERWPVVVERRLFPGVAPESYLTAELKGPSKAVLPGGQAHLFVGDDPAGVAQLALLSPGAPFTLPLGLDRAVKATRNVQVTDSEKGVLSKDDLSEYKVTLEVQNPYPVAVQTRIFDQWPATSDEHLEIKLLKTEPFALQHKPENTLEWQVAVPPHGVTRVSFTYTLRRPKGWRLHP